MSEDHLIRYCAPTLAGIKTGSLFSCACTSRSQLRDTVRKINKRLVPRGLRLLPLCFSDKKALMYVYRPSGLRKDLSQASALALLNQNGYCTGNCEKCIAQLARKLKQQKDFPHEIGLFLGYPPEDVQGFIDHNACGCKYTGRWKVYGDEEAARKRFAQYQKCDRIYRQCWENGHPLERLAIVR